MVKILHLVDLLQIEKTVIMMGMKRFSLHMLQQLQTRITFLLFQPGIVLSFCQ